MNDIVTDDVVLVYGGGSGGNVGIGVTAPAAKLDIAEPATGDTLKLGRKSGQSSIKSTASHLLIDSLSAGYVGLNDRIAGDVVLVGGGGDVGIGTSTPGSKLTVAGAISAQGTVTVGNYTLPIADGSNTYVLTTNGNGTVAWTAQTDTNTTYTAGDGLTLNSTDFDIDAAQTTITSILAADVKIGEDNETKIDFETADEIHFYAANVHQVKLIDNAFTPVADSDVDLGTSSLYWKDAYIDTVKTTGNIVAAGTVSASDPGGSAYGSSPHWTYVADNSGTNVPMTFVNRVGSGTATADTDGASATYNAAKAFDGNDGTFFEPANDAAQFPNWLKYDFGSGNAYTITAVTFRIDGGHDNYVDRAPKDWFAQGSNNDSDWVSLGTFPNTVFERVDAGQQNYVYLVTNDTAYRYIRITIDNVQNSGGLLRITEIKLSEMVAKGYAGNFVLEDDSGDEVTIEHNNEVKFIGSGITTNWTDTTPGTDGDPYDLTFTVDAAQTGITSLLATDIKIGEDDQTKVDFETANEIHLYADNANRATINSSGASIVGTLSAKDRLIASTGASLSGIVTIGGDLDLKDSITCTEAAIANGDYILFLDGGATGDAKKEAFADVVTLLAGDGLNATSSVLKIDVNELTDLTNTTFGTDNFGAGDKIAVADASASNATKRVKFPVEIGLAASDEGTALTTGTAKVTFNMPHAMTLTEVRANVNTAPVGSTILVDINEAGSTILSTKLMIDASEKTSTTAATPAVISDTAIADDAIITIDIDQIGSSTAGKGLKVWLIGYR